MYIYIQLRSYNFTLKAKAASLLKTHHKIYSQATVTQGEDSRKEEKKMISICRSVILNPEKKLLQESESSLDAARVLHERAQPSFFYAKEAERTIKSKERVACSG